MSINKNRRIGCVERAMTGSVADISSKPSVMSMMGHPFKRPGQEKKLPLRK
jgi:hypothetical protein